MHGDFIALSEKLGLVPLLDYRALELALDALTEVLDTSLAVNVSAKTLGEEDWIAFLAAAAARNPTLPRRLIVEITESAIVGNLDEAAHFVATIHALGGRVAIDDFGAGHTSFRNLRALDVDIVKIDGIFMRAPQTCRRRPRLRARAGRSLADVSGSRPWRSGFRTRRRR